MSQLLKIGKWFFLLYFVIPSICYTQIDTPFFSPKHRFIVSFKLLKKTIFENPKNVDEFSNIEYQINFRDKYTGKLWNYNYFDVYGGGNGKPASLDTIFKEILWSPSENFAVLPEEDWASAPGPPNTKAVNLDTSFTWSKSDFRLDNPVWLDSLRVVGNSFNDCNYDVVLFDGLSGETNTICEDRQPIGYKILGIKGDLLLVQTILDNCGTEADEKVFSSDTDSIKIKDLLGSGK